MHRFTSFALVLSVFAFASLANADDELPKGTGGGGSGPASKGTTDVATGGFEASGKVEDPAKAKDATELSVSAGGISNQGNSRAFAGTMNLTTRIRRGDEQFTGALAGNYARSKLPGQDAQTTVENEQAKLRYDHFITANTVLFLGLQGLRDRFRGLALRSQIDPGVGYYFINEAKELLWTEVGYDFLYDIRRDDALTVTNADGTTTTLDKTHHVHSARLFLGYTRTFNESVAFNTGLEYLQGLSETTSWRINYDIGFSAKLAKKFSLATTFSLKYDHNPLPGKENIDTITSVALSYTFL